MRVASACTGGAHSSILGDGTDMVGSSVVRGYAQMTRVPALSNVSRQVRRRSLST
jgi:hypothetical protein